MRVNNEEFVATLHAYMFASEDYSLSRGSHLNTIRLPINPGDGRMFPWLSAVARRYEHYSFKNLELIYKPAVSTLTNGNVAMCPIYDPADTTPTTRTVLLNTEGVTRTQVYKMAKLTIPKNRLNANGKYYIRSQGDHVLDPGELRNTDLGFVVLSVTDADGTAATYGDIFVRYTVEFHGPRIGSSGARVGYTHTDLNGAFKYVKDGVTAPFGAINSRWETQWTKKHNHPLSTLDYDIGYDDETYQYAGTAGGAASLVKFNEPFTGLMTLHRKHGLSTGSMGPHVVNGYMGGEHDDLDPIDVGQPLKTGKDHKWRTGITKFVSLVKDAGDAIKETWSVVCDVGDVIAITGAGAASAAEETAMTLVETTETMLPVFAGVLV